MVTSQPRKSRKRLYTLPNHLAQKQMTAHLSGDLIEKYDVRSTTIRKGDTVKIMRGEFRGLTGKIVEVDVRNRRVTVDGVTTEKADKTKIARPIAVSNVLITKLDLADKKRREKLGEKEAPKEPTKVPPAPESGTEEAPAKQEPKQVKPEGASSGADQVPPAAEQESPRHNIENREDNQ